MTDIAEVAGFRRVGGMVPYGSTELPLEAVMPVHDLAVGELMMTARRLDGDFADDLDVTRYTHSFGPIPNDEQDTRYRHVSVAVTHDTLPDGWRLVTALSTYNSEDRYSSKRILHYIEVMNGQLLEAKKVVFFIIGNATLFLMDDELYNAVTTERKMYERPLSIPDINRLYEFMRASANRAKAMRPRRIIP